ncbi:MAG: hypothetical protein QF437_00675 [Planctomycetota bacterium]|jgi:hypothetical protein|nr:hypothetical protein [Planctomycetota bacterium]MDP7128971.1 hypothetical protein [Planctomycetota bacterium]MDP7251206.1 hypothetical protein [Planctomycetota bacterium]|tara:strand:+ start:479 stop:613 length:135 start_codon:yes stop_codon:yes gene_type:complete
MGSKKSKQVREEKTGAEAVPDWKTLWPHLLAPVGIALLLHIIYG